ncbi:hypothetical protein [Streptomyces caatingaensis]|uniref:Knr4/Smi1-like domain-containing protein n=1 Tax=Streptomyces caatingaensis TaxID=1678637 RepID=A0A0K9XI85_9ACTN|nr:hypothetical protein [Streptomyces caatingaensis]KNB53013.1 hypothetical protein AC230_10460 [Streptomyces caatingaensis]
METGKSGLLAIDDLPEGFEYPDEFIRVVELGLTNLEPWWIFDGDLLRRRTRGLRERYPDRKLLPFARRQDHDDVACRDVDHGGAVVIHDFDNAGREQRARFEDFNSWLRASR